MKTTVQHIERSVKSHLPSGVYQGKWCGNKVTIEHPEGDWKLTTVDSIRGWGACEVVASADGKAIVIAKEK